MLLLLYYIYLPQYSIYKYIQPFCVGFKLYSDYLLISLNIEPLSHC